MTAFVCIVRIVALAAAALAMTSPAHARDWLRTEVPGVILYSDGYPHELERWALKVRLIDALLQVRYGGNAEDVPGSPLTIYLLKESEDVARLTGRKNLTGFYSPSSEGSYAIASRRAGYDKATLSGQMALFHEYAHHFMYRHFAGAYPAWYREGFAEYIASVSFDIDRNATVGLPAYPRLRHLRGDPMPIATILAASVEDFEPDERARFYAWSWKLVHMLGATTHGQQQLDRYLALFEGGMGSEAAATAAFGDLARLDARLAAYRPDERGARSVPIALAGFETGKVAVLDPLQSRLVDLRLERIAGQDRAAARDALRGLARQYPSQAGVWRELALAENKLAKGASRSAGLAAAQSAAGHALALEPGDARSLAIWADIEMRRLKAEGSADPSAWEAVRTRLRPVTGPQARDPLALTTYYRSYLSEPRKPAPAALDAMARAFALQPESYEIRFLRIYSLAMQGQMSDAQKLARVLASDPHAAALGQRALATLSTVAARTRAKTSIGRTGTSDYTEPSMQAE